MTGAHQAVNGSGSLPSRFLVTAFGRQKMTPAMSPQSSARQAIGTPSASRGLALHQRSRIHHHWIHLHQPAVRDRTVAAHCAHLAACGRAGLEYLRSLRNVSFAAPAQRLLRLQRPAADCVLYGCSCFRTSSDGDRDCHVSHRGEPFPTVRGCSVGDNRRAPSIS